MKNIFKRKPKVMKERTVSVAREYFELIVEVLIYVFFVNTFLLQSFVIPSASMENTLLIGDHLLVNKVAYSRSISHFENILLPQISIKRGMVVTFKAPPDMEKEYVKRVIGLPGETIRIAENKVYINAKALTEPYTYFKGGGISNFPPLNTYDWYEDHVRNVIFPHKYRTNVVDTPEGKVFMIPSGHYFCMGDNRDNSLDSRCWGPLPADYIVGKPWRIYWSYESNSDEYLTPGFIYKIKDLALTVVRFFTRTRWDRTVRAIK